MTKLSLFPFKPLTGYAALAMLLLLIQAHNLILAFPVWARDFDIRIERYASLRVVFPRP